jgi:hypothetical protein
VVDTAVGVPAPRIQVDQLGAAKWISPRAPLKRKREFMPTDRGPFALE